MSKRIVFNSMRYDHLTYGLHAEHHEFVINDDGAGEHWINGVQRAEIAPENVEAYIISMPDFPLGEVA